MLFNYSCGIMNFSYCNAQCLGFIYFWCGSWSSIHSLRFTNFVSNEICSTLFLLFSLIFMMKLTNYEELINLLEIRKFYQSLISQQFWIVLWKQISWLIFLLLDMDLCTYFYGSGSGFRKQKCCLSNGKLYLLLRIRIWIPYISTQSPKDNSYCLVSLLFNCEIQIKCSSF